MTRDCDTAAGRSGHVGVRILLVNAQFWVHVDAAAEALLRAHENIRAPGVSEARDFLAVPIRNIPAAARPELFACVIQILVDRETVTYRAYGYFMGSVHRSRNPR